MNRLHAYLLTRARIQRRQHTRKYRKGILFTAGWGVSALLAASMVVVILILAWQYSRLTYDLPSIDSIPRQLNAQSELFTRPTRLLDRSGSEVLLDLSTPGVQRKYVRISGVGDHVSQDFMTAIIAVTEPDFASSAGVRYDIWRPEDHPTIAQKLVFEMLLSQEPPSLRRVIREKLLAAQLMSRFGRERILEWYINSLSFGHLAYGVESGSQTYFGKSSSALTLPEAATLAGTALAPAINPWDSAAGAESLKQEVLKVMTLHGRITPAVFNAAVRVQVEITPAQDEIQGVMPAFTQAALAQVEQEVGKARMERGGLTVQTTLDASLQKELSCIIETQLAGLEGKQPDLVKQAKNCPASRLLPLLPPGDSVPAGRLAAGAMASDPQTGQVFASTGEISTLGVNPDFQDHPIGSLVTPLVYLHSYSQGYTPASLVWDAPENGSLSPDSPINPDGKYHGPVSIRKALANDYLQPVLNLLTQTGWHGFQRLANTMGLTLRQPETPETILDQRTNLEEVIRAYSILAAGGNRNGINLGEDPYPSLNYILIIWDEDGNTLVDHSVPDTVSIVSSPLAYLVTQPLSDDISRQPSMGFPTVLQLGTPTAAKIGVDPEKQHTWTVGFTADRIVGVWLGAAQPTATNPIVDYRWSAGIWRAAMDRSLEGIENRSLPVPPGVTTMKVCYPSGEIPSGDCPVTVDEVFVDGTEPKTLDTLYHRLTVNRETGRLATVFTAPELAQEQVFMDIPAEYTEWARTADLQIPPIDYDVIQNGNPDPAVHFSSPAMFSYENGLVSLSGSASSQDFSVYRIQIGEGLNPRTWRQVGPDGTSPVIEGHLADLDTTGLNGLYVLRLQVIDTQNRIRTAYLQLTVDNTPPAVDFAYPTAGQTIQLTDTPILLIRVNASDTISMEKVQVILDGSLLVEMDVPPYAYAWKASSGTHTLEVKGFDSVGNSATGQPITLTVE